MEEPRSIWDTLANLLILCLIGAVFLLPRDFMSQIQSYLGQERTAVADGMDEVPADTLDGPPVDPATVKVDVRYTTANSLNMRAAPSRNGAVVASLARGTRVSVTDTEGSWLLVRSDTGETGWINNSFASTDAPG